MLVKVLLRGEELPVAAGDAVDPLGGADDGEERDERHHLHRVVPARADDDEPDAEVEG